MSIFWILIFVCNEYVYIMIIMIYNHMWEVNKWKEKESLLEKDDVELRNKNFKLNF